MTDLRQELLLPASPEEVWRAFTTLDGVKGFFAPEARLELHPGGAYEMYFALDQPIGLRGGEGCMVLSIEPMQRLVFTWNFPPSLPSLRDNHQMTTVEVTLYQEKGGTRVVLVQSGWQEGEDWERGHVYFERAWGVVLSRLQRRFRDGPIDWSLEYR